MRLKKFVAFVCAFAMAFSCLFTCAGAFDSASLIDNILAEEVKAAGAQDVQNLIDTACTKGAGSTSDWFVFAIIQYKGSAYNYSKYISALEKYVESDSSFNATTAEKYALLFACCGSNKGFINDVLNNRAEELGIMSRVYALHLLNNGCTSSAVSSAQIVEWLLSNQHEDGGWGLNTASDVDVTAMVIQSLAQHKGENDVKSAINSALGYLSEKQQDDGSFMSYGVKNPESAAQVIVALTSLGINPLEDSRFVKNGASAVDSMLSFRATDYGYTHKAGGGYNVTATSQVLYALVSLYRFEHGRGGLYKIGSPVNAQTTAKQTTPPTTANQPATTAKDVQSAGAAVKTAKTTVAKPAGPAADAAQIKSTPKTTAQTHVYGRTTTVKSTHPAKKITTTAKNTNHNTASSTTAITSVVPAVAESTVKQEYTAQQTTLAAVNEQVQSDEQINNGTQNKIPLKKAAVAGVWMLALLCAFFLFACLKRRKISDYIVIFVVGALLTGVICISDIRRADEYYKAEEITADDTITVTMSIDCSTVAGKGDENITPSDGIILAPAQFNLEAGATAYDCLIAASKEYRIQIDDSSASLSDHSNAYIRGINYLYEFDYGELSGWMFSVNGTFGDVGCGSQTLSDGDVIEWQYTVNLGDDIK